MTYRISDVKKYMRCHRLYQLELTAEKEPYQPYLRIDEEVTLLAIQKLGASEYFLGERGDDSSRLLNALDEYDWFVKARLEYKDFRVKIPILHKLESGYEIYFIYVGLYPHAFDMQYYCSTIWVLENNGIHIKDVHIVHLNQEYERKGDIDVDQLFTITDFFYNNNNNPTIPILETIEQNYFDYSNILDEMSRAAEAEILPPYRDQKCMGRQKCKYYDYCFPNEVEVDNNSILTLVGAQHKYEMAEEGKEHLKDTDVERIEGTKLQFAQIMADTLGETYFDELALKNWLDSIQYPVTFLDFEWERFAIPPYEGMHPNDVLPFEYSVHILNDDGTYDHKVYLSIHDDREDMAKNLISDIPSSGTILAYNADGAEKIRIQELADQYEEYRTELNNINDRIKDLQVLFANGIVYDVRMKGQWSLKSIMAMLDEDAYRELDIHDGMSAVFEWRHLDYLDEDVNKEEIIENLKAYCGMDSYAMLVVYQWLCELVNQKNR